ncbi:SPX domain-containing protein 1-like isoform X2 [Herrania umbratica]|uniref:SPX domain-containing protein 1-like isoform X2 n=1 Tax=Herrania umbratica TaxID=108875 RepID=A0A6J1BGH1_9ROSI|nr:SPX domain-containing protein 1-like isoform X2 [Herrania umbratica]
MKHGKRHRAEVAKSLPGWKRKFMSYKALKQQVKQMNPHFNGKKRSRLDNGKYSQGGSSEGNSPVQDTGFTLLLDRELHKVNAFYIDKEEDYVISFRELQIRAENLNGDEENLELLKDILDFHAEMVMLLHFSVTNFTGLVKIVKKHKKKAGASVYSPYMPRVLQQPFFSTDLLYNLIRGCEAILGRLSPPSDP